MIIKIYKGTNEIGGSCIELKTDNTTLLLDWDSDTKFGIAKPFEMLDKFSFILKDIKDYTQNETQDILRVCCFNHKKLDITHNI